MRLSVRFFNTPLGYTHSQSLWHASNPHRFTGWQSSTFTGVFAASTPRPLHCQTVVTMSQYIITPANGVTRD